MNKIWNIAGVLLLTFCTQTNAGEVYRWTDSNGAVHFSDRKPADDAEDITKEISTQNIDESQEELRRLQKIFREEDKTPHTSDNLTEQQREAVLAKKRDLCNDLRKRLKIFSGRMQVIDKNGKEVRFTDKQREEHRQKLAEAVRQHCSNLH